MKKQTPITMKDIAREFGVSVATVSRALNNDPRISSEKRETIRAFAKENNFYPNIIGEQLRHAKKKPLRLIGVIIPQLPHFYFSSILSGIEEEASERGYQMIVAKSNEQYAREVKICEDFFRTKVCGVIVSQAKDTQHYEHFQKLIDHNIPLVFYDRISTGVNASRVVVDDYTGAYTAVSHLIETGCRHIAYYGAANTLEISKNRHNGYKDALLKHNIKINESLMRLCDNRQLAEEITPELLKSSTPPDAFFCVNDDTAIGVLYTAKHLGLRIPEDISICGFTNGERAVACDPPLTTVEQRGICVGREATNVLINQVEGITPMDKIERRIVRTKLVIRGTTRL